MRLPLPPTAAPTLALLALLASLAGGCVSPGDSGSAAAGAPAVVEESKRFRFPDVPVPVGLSLDAARSFVFETPATRAGHLVYQGALGYEDTIQFYRSKLPEHGWKLVTTFERGEASMIFEKPGWVANVHISRSTFTTQVDINVGPRAQSIVEQDIPRKR